MDRPAADTWSRVRTAAALAAVFAVLVMHGLTCMAGGAHAAGIVAAAAPSTAVHVISEAGPHHPCPDCHNHGGGPASSGLQITAMSAIVGGAEHPGEHGGVPCIAVLNGLALLALLAAASATAGPPGVGAQGVWLSLRPRPPTALLRPSLSRLCVLRI